MGCEQYGHWVDPQSFPNIVAVYQTCKVEKIKILAFIYGKFLTDFEPFIYLFGPRTSI